MPANTLARQAAMRLKVVLQTRLTAPDVDEPMKNALYQSIMMVERFIKNAKGSDAEFVVLKQKVEEIIKNHMKATKATNARRAREREEVARRKPPPPPTPPTPRPVSPVDYTLPPLMVQRKACSVVGNYDALRRQQDKTGQQQVANELRQKRKNQANTRTNLGRQIEDRNEWRREQLRLKAKAYDESEQAINNHKAALQREHEEERERVRLDRLDKERQITEMRMRLKAEKDYADLKEKEIVDKAKAEIAAHEAYLRQKAKDDKVYLMKVVNENNQRLFDRMEQAEAEKAYNAKIAAEGVRRADAAEAARLAELERIRQRALQALKFGGMEELLEARERKFREEDERTRRDQRRYEDEQDADLAAREARRVKMERDVKAARDQQSYELRMQKEQEVRDSEEMRRKLEEESEYYKMIEKEHDELRLLLKKQEKERIRKQWRHNQHDRFHQWTLPETEFEAKRNSVFFKGLRSTVPDDPGLKNYSTSILFH